MQPSGEMSNISTHLEKVITLSAYIFTVHNNRNVSNANLFVSNVTGVCARKADYDVVNSMVFIVCILTTNETGI